MARRSPQQVGIMRKQSHLPLREVAKICGVTENAVHRWRREGLTSVKVGSFRYIDLNALIAKFGPEASKMLGLYDHFPVKADAPKR